MKTSLTIALCLLLSAIVVAGSWEYIGLGGYQVISLESDPADTQYIYAGTTSGLYLTDNGGGIWSPTIPFNVQVPFIANYPLSAVTVVKLIGGGSNSDGFYFSVNRGLSWNVIVYLMNPRGVGFDPVDTGLIYFALADGILTSGDFGQSVSPANNGLPDLDISDVLGDGRNNLEAYAIGATFVAHTTDFGNSWDTLSGLFGLEDYNPARIAHDALCSETLYVSCYANIAISENGGASWRYTAMQGVGFQSIACDPDTPGKVFVGSADGYGVFESVDAGLSFIPINGNLGNLHINCLKFLANGKLLAGTADGVYKYDFNAGVENELQALPDNFALLQNYPNPFNAQTTIQFGLSKSENIMLYLYNLTGLNLQKHSLLNQPSGINRITLDMSEYPSGIYFLRLSTSEGVAENIKLTLIK
jgi:hypothetical protein